MRSRTEALRRGAALLAALAVAACSGPAGVTHVSRDVASQTFASGESYRVIVPVFSTIQLADGSSPATLVVIGIPQETVQARMLLRVLTELTARAPGGAPAVVVVPQFPTESDARHLRLAPTTGVWDEDGWSEGDRSLPSEAAPIGVSSYAVVDNLVATYLDRTRYPKVRAIAIVGFAAAGDFVQRYALLNRIDGRVRKRGIDFRYVAGSPSSFMYVTPLRPDPRDGGFRRYPIAECPGFDRYAYGVEVRNAYGRILTRQQVEANAQSRPVRYVVSRLTEPGAGTLLDASCAAEAQGATRLARALSYYRYLQATFGTRQRSTLRTVAVGTETEEAIFGTACGLHAILGAEMQC